MDISINSNLNINKPQFEQAGPVARQAGPVARQMPEAKAERPVLSVTQAPVPAGEDIDITVPESALSRDDKLGTLVSSAFVLSAPPMPNFS